MRIAIVTPARNEQSTLPQLYNSLKQAKKVEIEWVIIENGSTDNTHGVASSFRSTDSLHVTVKQVTGTQKYSVGSTLSNILADALEEVKKDLTSEDLDFFGIFDADISFAPDYICQLTKVFLVDNKLVLTSGIGLVAGEHDGEGQDHVRGNARIWKWNYLKSRTIPRGPSWDSISKFEVLIEGFHAYPVNIYYHCRAMGAKQENFRFYGYAAHYRGVSVLFAVMKMIKMLGSGEGGFSYLYGYISNRLVYKEVSDNLNLRQFVNHYSRRKVLRWLIKK